MSAARSSPAMPASPRPEPASAVFAPSAVTLASAQDRHPRPSLSVSGPIPIRTVPRAAVDALVARLVAAGTVPAPRPSEAL